MTDPLQSYFSALLSEKKTTAVLVSDNARGSLTLAHSEAFMDLTSSLEDIGNASFSSFSSSESSSSRWDSMPTHQGKQDGAIYGIPHDAANVLRIHPTEGVTLHGDYPLGGHKWHGASAAPDGTIVGVPANADSVLCIVPGSPAPTSFADRPWCPTW